MDEKISYLILKFQRFNNQLLLNQKFFLLNISHRIYNIICFLYGCYLPIDVSIGPSLSLPHGLRGVYIAGGTKIGGYVTILHQVTIGSNYHNSKHGGPPTIGDNCFLGAGSKVIGPIYISHNCKIGANTVVVKDLAPGSTCVLSEPRIIENI